MNHERYTKVLNAFGPLSERVKVIEHAPEGQTDKVSAIRGNALGHAAKAMVLKLKGAQYEYLLAIIPGDKLVDFKAVARATNCKKASFAPIDKAAELTGFEMGAVPQSVFNET